MSLANTRIRYIPFLGIFGLVILFQCKSVLADAKDHISDFLDVFLEDPNMTCMDAIAEMSEKQMAAVEECKKSLPWKTPQERKGKGGCVLKCVMQKEGIILQDGMFNGKMIGFLEKVAAPPNLKQLKEKALQLFQECRAEYEPKFDQSDPACKAYGEMTKCILEILFMCMENSGMIADSSKDGA